MAPRRIPPADRLLKHSQQQGDCILWTGSKSRDGYGVMRIGRNGQFRVHRVAFELNHGPIPDGMHVCHQCDTPLCINPKHLFLGTPKDNMIDKVHKGRGLAPTGESHGMSKLSDQQVDEIRRLRASGMKLKVIAEQFGISFQHVSGIYHRRFRA